MGQAAFVLESAERDDAVSSAIMPSGQVNKVLARGCDLWIAEDNARHVFSKYITSGKWVSYFKAFDFCDGDLQNNASTAIGDGHSEEKSSSTRSRQQKDALKNISLCAESKTYSGDTDLSDSVHASYIIASCFSTEEMKATLLAILFPLFIQSKVYAEWIDSVFLKDDLPLHKMSLASPSSKSIKIDNGKRWIKREKRLDELFRPNPRTCQDIIADAADSIEESELDRLICHTNWLTHLLAMVEELPLSVSLANARSDRSTPAATGSFPLVYVNKAFSTVFGRPRHEIVGRSSTSFHRSKDSQRSVPEEKGRDEDSDSDNDDDQEETIATVNRALAQAHPCKAIVNCMDKNGSKFANLVAFKPIFDANGEYAYVICVQLKVSDGKASTKDTLIVEDLLSILPNMIK